MSSRRCLYLCNAGIAVAQRHVMCTPHLPFCARPDWPGSAGDIRTAVVVLEQYFFDGWGSLLRTLVIGVLAYVALVVLLRIFGNRTLSKMNAFDLIVTVALGSTLATVLLNKDIALAEGVLAFALLIGLQFVVTWTSVRARWVRRWVTGEPRMLLYRGEFLPENLTHARVTQDEVRAAVRSAGLCEIQDAAAVILETDGSFSVIPRGEDPCRSVLSDVQSPPTPKANADNHPD